MSINSANHLTKVRGRPEYTLKRSRQAERVPTGFVRKMHKHLREKSEAVSDIVAQSGQEVHPNDLPLIFFRLL